MNRRARRLCAALLLAALALGPPACRTPEHAEEAPQSAAEGKARVRAFGPSEALRLGERIYRQGLDADGNPIQAVVEGDVVVDGRMFTCVHCHLRSGLGTIEGDVFSPRINGPELFRARRLGGAWSPPPKARSRKKDIQKDETLPPLSQAEDIRPAYTEETLARAIRAGVDPAGRAFDPIMPRYMLDDENMALLIRYLENLSARWDPGVTETTIRFATVVSEGVDPVAREAMMGVLRAYVRARNATTRGEVSRARRGPYFRSTRYTAFRKLDLDLWELRGPRSSWPEQLRAFYARKPVFALLGGMVEGDWGPVHRFCEDEGIPALFPLTDEPVVDGKNWYTLYFSKGWRQEGETAARYLRRALKHPETAGVAQVHRMDAAGRSMARGFSETWTRFGFPAPDPFVLGPDEAVTGALWATLLLERPKVVLLWLAPEDLGGLLSAVERLKPSLRPEFVFIPGGRIPEEGALKELVPPRARPHVFITYPRDLLRDSRKKRTAVKAWLRVKNLPVTRFDIQAKMYFLGWMLSGALGDMRSEFYRDSFLEGIDMMVDQTYAIAVYPRLSFGPGQRYASKGCYVLQLTGGPTPVLIKKSAWVIH